MTADWADWNPHPHMALAQYSQGVPLARNAGGMGTGTGAIAANGTTNLIASVAIDQPSFQMLIGFEYTMVGTLIPFGKLRFLWQDTASGFQVDPDWTILVGGFAALDFVHIIGPAKADTLTIACDNLDTMQALSFSFGISKTSHVFSRFRVQEVGQPGVPVFTRAGQNNQMGILGSVGVNVPASSHVDRLCSAWGGPAGINVDNSAGTVAILVQVLDPGIIAGASPLYGTSGAGVIWSANVAAGQTANAELPLPYGPVAIRETNASATTAVQPTTTLTRLEP